MHTSKFLVLHLQMYQITPETVLDTEKTLKNSGGACPQTPLDDTCLRMCAVHNFWEASPPKTKS